MAYTQNPLPYEFDALEPHIDAKTMEIHYEKHHAGYVAKLNAALEAHGDLMGKPVEWLMENLDQVPENARTAVQNNGGGHFNHSLFWEVMAPNATDATGELKEAIEAKWGSVEKFKDEFAAAAGSRFGSGWAWLSVDSKGDLVISSTPNQDNPLMEGMVPVFGLDVWEHAYYLNYQNRRPDYIEAWFNVLDGEKANEKYLAALEKVRG